MKKIFKENWIAFLVNIIAGIVMYFATPLLNITNVILVSIIIASIFIVSTTTVIIVIRIKCGKCAKIECMENRLNKLENIGISNILDSMTEGEGSTGNIIASIRNDFYFMGIAAKKWVYDRNVFGSKVKEIGTRYGTIRFLLLNPNSTEAKKISYAQDKDENHVPGLIIDTIRDLFPYVEKGIKIEVRLYDFIPIYRIAVVDNKKMFVGFYESRTEGKDSTQLVLERNAAKSIYKPFYEYFESVWNDKKTIKVDISKIKDENYIKGLGV